MLFYVPLVSPIEDGSVKKYKLGVSNHIDVGEKICTQQL